MCGIFGWHGSDLKTFNPYQFSILGILNDSRGGDGCGYSINGTITKEAGKIEKFKDMLNSSVISELENNKENTILGHTRKTSVGKSCLENTHPFGHGSYESGYEVVLTHNGTLYDYEDLAKKYNIDIDGKTDSYMLSVSLHNDIDVFKKILSEYTGGAAIAAIDRTNNHFYIFKGRSKKTTYSKEEEDERPVSLAFVNETNFYYSSELNHLIAAGFDKDNILDLKPNVLHVFENGLLLDEIEIDRSERTQSKPYVYTNTYNSSYNENMQTSMYDYGYNYEEDVYGSGVGFTQKNKGKNTVILNKTEMKEIAGGNKIIFKENRYYLESGGKANGYCWIENDGNIRNKSYTGFNQVKSRYVFFLNGIPNKSYIQFYKNDSTVYDFSLNLLCPVFVSENGNKYVVNPGKKKYSVEIKDKNGYIPLYDIDKNGNKIGFLGEPIIVKEEELIVKKKLVNKKTLCRLFDSYILNKENMDKAFLEKISIEYNYDTLKCISLILDYMDSMTEDLFGEDNFNEEELKNIIGDDYIIY